MKKTNRVMNFIRQENGGVTAIFMIMLPMMLAFFVLAFDGSRVMMKRARLADGLNEAALAIAASLAKGMWQLHQAHHQTHPTKDKTVSIGLIRMANIAPLVVVAR